jgi:type IV fimbrial biogenesis protein FimT
MPAENIAGRDHSCCAGGFAVRSDRGFTLIELMMSITILAILVGVAAPSMTALVRGQRVKSATSDLYASLAFARSEAIKRNANIDVVPAASDWGAGWQILSGTTALKSQNALAKVAISGPGGTVTYQRDGRLSGTSVPTFVVTSSEDTTIVARCVRVDLSGRPNIKVDTNHKSSDGCQ